MRTRPRSTIPAICLLVATIMIVHASAASAAAQACAARDLAVMTLIEERGEAQSLPAHEIADAFFSTMEARRACKDGRSEEALAIYARVTARLNGAAR